MLEAREKAEKVWYPVVWEKVKDASNIIDYDIHDEITKDASAVINANNDTTTGMATVIPWVNAPKLIYDTSICKIDKPHSEKPISVAITGRANNNQIMSNFVYTITTDLDFWSNTSSLTIPVSSIYRIHFEWWDQQEWATPDTWWTNTFTILDNWEDIGNKTVPYRTRCYIDMDVVLREWHIIQFKEQTTTTWSSLFYCLAEITRL